MIAASLKDAEGDSIIDLLLRKDADVNVKSASGQVRLPTLRISFHSKRYPESLLCHPDTSHLTGR
jgi:hypothetical protein